MARRDERRPAPNDAPRPNVLADGNPVPNVLRGFVPPHGPGTPTRRPGGVDRAAQRAAPRRERRPADAPRGERTRPGGWGCGGWLGLLVLFFLAARLIGACDEILAPGATSPTGTASTPAAGTMVDIDELAPGDCFLWSGESGGVTSVNKVDCSQAHDAEVTGLTELPDPPDGSYDEAAVTAAAEVRCNAVFTEYAGEPAVPSAGSSSSFIYPGAEGWQQGDRTVICLAEGDSPGTLTGSIRRSDAP